VAQVNIKHKINRSYVKAALATSPGVRRMLLVRGLAVQTAAKQRLNEAPRRIDTGRLRNSIQIQELFARGAPIVRVGTNVDYAMVIHDGSKPHVILPRNASVLAWQGPSGMIFAKRVNHPGFPPNPFLRDGLQRGMAKFNG
jgi:hypothetical protein